MRGSSQAVLLQANDGKHYVVKAPHNPNGRRTLVNEWLGYHILNALHIATPDVRPIKVSATFLQNNPGMSDAGNGKRTPMQFGTHLASEYVGDGTTAVYDFLPTTLLREINNVADFIGALTVDKWLANTDNRQCVFARSKRMPKARRVAYLIDHGQILNGRHWNFKDSPVLALYMDRSVYATVNGWDSFAPWIEQVKQLDLGFFETVASSIPSEWIDGDRLSFERLAERLIGRRQDIPVYVEALRESAANPFANWTRPRTQARIHS